MILKNLLSLEDLNNVDLLFHNLSITSLCSDSRKVKKGSLFVALEGMESDGTQFIDKAIDQGAQVIVSKKKKDVNKQVCFIQKDDPKQFLRKLAKRFYSTDSDVTRVIGITGTNGKTTISYILESIFQATQESCGVVGTINARVGVENISTTNTTPDFLDNQEFLSFLRKDDIAYCVMEVSSHGLEQGRVDLIDFDVAIFSNLTRDHLDYHRTMDEYFLEKQKLFSYLKKDGVAVINRDDHYGQRLLSNIKPPSITFGLTDEADVVAKNIKITIDQSIFDVSFSKQNFLIKTSLVGMYNIYNILAAIATALSLGVSSKSVQKGIESLKCIPGRLEKIKGGQNFDIIIDYAHTSDALENVLKTIKPLCTGKLIVVFGCGGNRDKAKRPAMAEIASHYADFIVVTSDNPRGEDPQAIIDDILTGIKTEHVVSLLDRKQAICKALKQAKKNDIVLLVGKGHENYQIFKNKTIEFNEKNIIKEFLNANS